MPTGDDMTMEELHQRDLRNSATPVHHPVVQHVDYVDAIEKGLLDEEEIEEGEGDGEFAKESHDYVEEQDESLHEFKEDHDESTEEENEERLESGEKHGDAMDDPDYFSEDAWEGDKDHS